MSSRNRTWTRPSRLTPFAFLEYLLKKVRDYDAASEEFFGKRKDRRKPKGRRKVKELYAGKDDAERRTFTDPNLQALFERGYLTEILRQLKSGKEATVYLARGQEGLLAAKVYSDQQVRSFKNDQVYRQGRFVGDARIKKAIEQRSRSGMGAQQALWIFHEYLQLWALYRAGLPVPKPTVGPSPDDIGMAGRVVLMDYIGDEEEAAPRLADIRLTEEEARSAWAQSLDIMSRILKLGKVHGDFSTYNLLWWQGEVIVIDFPQVIDLKENPNAEMLLRQDVESLCKSFKKLGIREEPGEVLREVRARANLT